MPGKRTGRYAGIGKSNDGENRILDECTPELLGDLVVAMLRAGDAILFGITRDGGSVRVILMSGDEKTSEYLSTGTELDTFAKNVKDHITKTLL